MSGLLASYIIYIPIEYFISTFIGIPMAAVIPSSALILGICLGIILPMIGMLVPIRRALTKTLRDSLDIYHNVVFETLVSIRRLENIGLSIKETLAALFMVIIGFIVYYIIPLSFTFNNWSLFFQLLTSILLCEYHFYFIHHSLFKQVFQGLFILFFFKICLVLMIFKSLGMVLGQNLLGLALHHPLEILLTKLLIWGKDTRLREIVVKNLESHKKRNGKTALMFTLCLSYVVFAAVMFSLQSNSLAETIEWTVGADIAVVGPTFSSPLPEADLRNYLDEQRIQNQTGSSIVVDYTFLSYPLSESPFAYASYASGIGHITSTSIHIIGLEQNFLDVALLNYYSVAEEDPYFTSDNAIKNLFQTYTPNSEYGVPPPISITSYGGPSQAMISNNTLAYSSAIPIVLSSSIQSTIYTPVTDLIEVEVDYINEENSGNYPRYYLAKPVAFVSKVPSFISISRLVTTNTPALVSMDSYFAVLNDINRLSSNTAQGNMIYNTTNDIPKGSLLIKLIPEATDQQILDVIDHINTLINNDKIQTTNLRFAVSATSSASFFLNVFFNIGKKKKISSLSFFCFYSDLWPRLSLYYKNPLK